MARAASAALCGVVAFAEGVRFSVRSAAAVLAMGDFWVDIVGFFGFVKKSALLTGSVLEDSLHSQRQVLLKYPGGGWCEVVGWYDDALFCGWEEAKKREERRPLGSCAF